MAAGQKKLVVALLAVVLVWRAEPVTSAEPARRIVSLVPNVTEMLFAVGAGSQVVGVSTYDDFPPETKSLPRVGALLDPDTERILSLRPDLVIVYGSQTELESQFARAGIRVYAYRHGGVDNVLQTMRELGTLIKVRGWRHPRSTDSLAGRHWAGSSVEPGRSAASGGGLIS